MGDNENVLQLSPLPTPRNGLHKMWTKMSSAFTPNTVTNTLSDDDGKDNATSFPSVKVRHDVQMSNEIGYDIQFNNGTNSPKTEEIVDAYLDVFKLDKMQSI